MPAEAEHAAAGEEKEAHGAGDGHEAEPERREVSLTADALEEAGVRVEEARPGRLAGTVRATAVIEHDVSRVAHISPLVGGQIIELKASLGDHVDEGQVVAVMRSVELGKARAAVVEARTAVEVAGQNFDRIKRLREQKISSERSFIEARGEKEVAQARYAAAMARLKTYGVSGGSGPTYPLRSRLAGTIIQQHASLGETKGPEDALFEVADQSVVWVIGRVYEKDVFKVKQGMKAVVTLNAYPEQSFGGTIDWISSTVDKEARVLPVRVVLENTEGIFRPGLFGTLVIAPEAKETQVPLVPVDAVQKLGDETVLFVPGEGKGRFVARPVTLGVEAGTLVEVTGGLKPNEKVVTRGAFDLKATLTARGRGAGHHH